MLSKKFVKSRQVAKLTFEVDFAAHASQVEVVGEFNGWQPQPLSQGKAGIYKLTLEAPSGRAYQYRYRIDGAWANEQGADGYVANPFGGYNSVVQC